MSQTSMSKLDIATGPSRRRFPSLTAFGAIVKARNMEFVRDKGSFFWNLFFPFFLILVLTFIFAGGGSAVFTVGTIGNVPEDFPLFTREGVEHINYSEKETAEADILDRIRKHQLNMYINFEENVYYVNNSSAGADILRSLINIDTSLPQSSSNSFGLRESQVVGEPIPYTDWLAPGIIGMNLMFSCLFGVGYVLVRYRKNGVLKRIKATPVSALNFVSAQAASRYIIVLISVAVTFGGVNLIVRFLTRGSWLLVKGSWFDLLLITSLGIVCMISLGLLFAARIKSEELAGGLMNLVTFPMMMLSGIFFSLDNTPQIVQQISRIIPLTHLVEGARAIMLEGANLLAILPNILYLGILSAVLLLVSALLFKWE